MKKIIWIIIIVLLLGIGYQNRTVLAQEIERVTYFSPCDTPIKYKLGSIDNQFNLTQDEFKKYIADSAAIWNTAEGKQLFVYDPEGPLTVSLKYDERQSLNTQINQLDTKLDEQNKKLAPEIKAYEQRVASFKQKAAQLNQEIDNWNSKGGAPMDVYQGLVSRQQALQTESRQLQSEAAALGQSTDSYNSDVQELTQTVDVYNQALKFKPEEGIYIQDQDGRRIIIYFYNSPTELTHTLAHELGHAVGLEHLANNQAIMFSKTNNAVNVTDDDLAALREVCRRRSIVEIAQTRVAEVIARYKAAAK
jgi:predicted Zn-dependent protease